LKPTNLGALFSTGFAASDPLVVQVPGLLIGTSVGSNPPPPIHISLDDAAGTISTLAELQNLTSAFTVQGQDAFLGYNNLSPGDVVQALIGVAHQLGIAGTGGIFGDKLPLIQHGLSDVIDLAKAFQDNVGLPSASDIPTAQDLLTFLDGKVGAGA